jgi:hypothetical protein
VTSPDACEVIERLATFPQGPGAELRVSTASCGLSAVVLFRVWRLEPGRDWTPTDSAWTVPARQVETLVSALRTIRLPEGSAIPVLADRPQAPRERSRRHRLGKSPAVAIARRSDGQDWRKAGIPTRPESPRIKAEIPAPWEESPAPAPPRLSAGQLAAVAPSVPTLWPAAPPADLA